MNKKLPNYRSYYVMDLVSPIHVLVTVHDKKFICHTDKNNSIDGHEFDSVEAFEQELDKTFGSGNWR